MVGADLPDTHGVALPRRTALTVLRPLARLLIRCRYRVHVHGADNVRAQGPVIVASNHVGVIDGPLLAIFTPRRPVHALTKIEMFRGRLGGFLRWSGQIPLDRWVADPAAIKTCLAVLRSGRAIGIFPEGSRGAGEFERFHAGAAYLALVTGAPIVPVTMIGTREPGAGGGSLPGGGAVIDIVHGEPFRVAATPWPRTREQVRDASLLLREHMIAQSELALARTGRTLPGPLPIGQQKIDDDPETGVVEQGA